MSSPCKNNNHDGTSRSMYSEQERESSQKTRPLENIHDIPYFVREHESTLTFPEKLMLMITHVEKTWKNLDEAPVVWAPGGQAFTVRDPETLTADVIPIFFERGKFSSFMRKLYRWGFRQVSIPSSSKELKKDEMHFGNDYFQRDNKDLMVKMKSTTVVGRRRAAKGEKKEQKKKQNEVSLLVDGASCSFAVGTKRSASDDWEREAASELKRRALFLSNRAMANEYPTAREALGGAAGAESDNTSQYHPNLHNPAVNFQAEARRPVSSLQQRNHHDASSLHQHGASPPDGLWKEAVSAVHQQKEHRPVLLQKNPRPNETVGAPRALFSSIPHHQLNEWLIQKKQAEQQEVVARQILSQRRQQQTALNILQNLQHAGVAEGKEDVAQIPTHSIACIQRQLANGVDLLAHQQNLIRRVHLQDTPHRSATVEVSPNADYFAWLANGGARLTGRNNPTFSAASGVLRRALPPLVNNATAQVPLAAARTLASQHAQLCQQSLAESLVSQQHNARRQDAVQASEGNRHRENVASVQRDEEEDSSDTNKKKSARAGHDGWCYLSR